MSNRFRSTPLVSPMSVPAAVDLNPEIPEIPVADPNILTNNVAVIPVSSSTPMRVSPRRRSPRRTTSSSPEIQQVLVEVPQPPIVAAVVDTTSSSFSSSDIKMVEIPQPPMLMEVAVAEPTSSSSSTELPPLPTSSTSEFEIPLPVLPPVFSDYQGEILIDDVEQELFGFGYIVKEKIIVTLPTGQQVCKYILCINKRGQNVLVALEDYNGQVHVSSRDLMVRVEHDITLVPYEIQAGMMECAGNEVCSIALDCKSGLCVLQQDMEKLQPVASNFVFSETRADRYAQMGTMPIPYPIIKLSEIKANPREALNIENRITKNLRAQIIALERKSVEDLAVNAVKVHEMLGAFRDESLRALDGTLSSLEYLDAQLVGFMQHKDTVMPEAQQRLYRDTIYNMKVREEWLVYIFHCMDDVGRLHTQIKELSVNMAECIEKMAKIAHDSGMVIADVE